MKLQSIINEAIMQLKPEVFKHLMTPAVIALDKAVRNAGFELRIVGGAVRDMVQGIDPKDIDMASDARPEQMMELLDQAGIRHEPTGLDHGTITMILDGEPIEITTLRIDSDQDGRHATVQFTNDWRKDAERRDLTFNAMSMEMNGTLHDYFDGAEDLENGVARFVGNPDARIQEDFLRILRFFRFQGRLNFPTWDKETMGAVRRNADGLAGISGERIWMEMEKILANKTSRADVLKRMDQTDVLAGIGMPTNRIGSMRNVIGDNPAAALAACINTVDELFQLHKRWKFDNNTHKTARFCVEHRNIPFGETEAQRMLADPKIRNEHVFALVESRGRAELLQKLKTWTPPEFPINGSDLMAAGVESGPKMGLMLAQLRDAWEQSGFKLTRDELLRDVAL
jgi:tRNA nucleotidyltransferase (CCA-adding enzyme)